MSKALIVIWMVIVSVGIYNDYLGNYDKSQSLYLFVLAMYAIESYRKKEIK